MHPSSLSQQLLLHLKVDKKTTEEVNALARLDMVQLESELIDDQSKKAFWINIYNSFYLILRKQLKLDKSIIYRQKAIEIAGQSFSLDDIEHGILRRYRYKWTLGFMPNPFAPRLIKRLAVDNLDYRIHFALNCGANSCPPIAFYKPANIDSQLEMATLSFLESETTINADAKTLEVSRLFLWFTGDFGGRRGTRKIISKYLQVDTEGYKLIYKEYDWTENLDNFSPS